MNIRSVTSSRTLVAAIVAVVASCAVASVAGAATAARSAATLTFCSDMSYPPMESIQGGKPVGADIDIANAVARNLGMTASFRNIGFDAIIPALLGKKCDAVISAMTNTAARRKQVDFANYVTVGMSLMVKKGNPSGVTDLASLSGKTAAVEAATTEKDALDALNKTLAKQGKKPVSIKIFPADTNAAAALLAGKVDVYFADATPVLYYIKKTGGKFETVGDQLDSAPEGIATRKGDPLGAKLAGAVKALYADGSMAKILASWGISAFALKQ